MEGPQSFAGSVGVGGEIFGLAPASAGVLFCDQLPDAICRRLPASPYNTEDLHAAVLRSERFGSFEPGGRALDTLVELSLKAGDCIEAQRANAPGGLGKSSIRERRAGDAAVGPISLFALHSGHIVDQRIGGERRRDSGGSHLH